MLDQDNQKVQNKQTDRRMLTGMFQDRESSERAYNAMHERGYSEDDIDLMMSDETRKKHWDTPTRPRLYSNNEWAVLFYISLEQIG
ncbi:MAG: hypothetical protein IPN72_23215 [Saprospiraceae bacterium]|nr:hypothetical protein [Saprospiraceae bacterium]